MSAGDDELLEETIRRLAELEAEEQDLVELGERVELAELENFRGRWRGVGPMRTKDGTKDVYLLWDETGQPRFHYQTTRLVWEIEDLNLQVGDEIAIVRGKDLPATGDRNPTQRFAVRIRPCKDPLPGQGEQADEIPF